MTATRSITQTKRPSDRPEDERLSLVFNHMKRGNPTDPSVFAASPVRVIRTDMIRVLKDGDRYVDGRLVGADGKVVPVVDDEPDGSGH